LLDFLAVETARLLLNCPYKVVQQLVAGQSGLEAGPAPGREPQAMKPSLFTPDSGSTDLLTNSPLSYLQWHFTAFFRTEWYSPNGKGRITV
jgi:hypothetical protein